MGSGTGAGPGILLNECTGKNYVHIMQEGDVIKIISVDGDISMGSPQGLMSFEAKEIEVIVKETVAFQVGGNYVKTSGQATDVGVTGSLAVKTPASLSATAGASLKVNAASSLQVASASVDSKAGILTVIAGLAKVSLGAGTQKGLAILLNVMGGMKSSSTSSKLTLIDGTILHGVKSIVNQNVSAMLLSFFGYSKTSLNAKTKATIEAGKIHINP